MSLKYELLLKMFLAVEAIFLYTDTEVSRTLNLEILLLIKVHRFIFYCRVLFRCITFEYFFEKADLLHSSLFISLAKFRGSQRSDLVVAYMKKGSPLSYFFGITCVLECIWKAKDVMLPSCYCSLFFCWTVTTCGFYHFLSGEEVSSVRIGARAVIHVERNLFDIWTESFFSTPGSFLEKLRGS